MRLRAWFITLALTTVIGTSACQSDLPVDPSPTPAPAPKPTPAPAPQKPAGGPITTFFPTGAILIPTSSAFQDTCGAVSTFGLIYNVLRAETWLQANGYGAITLHYLYRSGKASPNRCKPTASDTAPAPSTSPAWNDGCDFNITGTAGPLIKLVNNASATAPAADTVFTTLSSVGRSDVWPQYPAHALDGSQLNIGFMGGPFAIQAGAPATAFTKLLQGTITALDSENNAIDFSPFRNTASCSFGSTHHVNVFRTSVNFFAEDNLDFNAQPPRVALIDTNNAKYTKNVSSGILQKYLVNAGLAFAGAQGCPVGGNNVSNKAACPLGSTSGQIFDLFDFADVTNNLISAKDAKGNPRYAAVWAPHWDTTSTSTTGPNANETTAATNVSSFLDGQTGLAAECASIEGFEGDYKNGTINEQHTNQWLTCKNNGTGGCAAGAANEGIDKDSTGTPYNTLKNCTDPDEVNGNSCSFFSYPGDSFAQLGDYLWVASGGSVQSFAPAPETGSIYRPLVKPLISGVKTLDTTKTSNASIARGIIINDFTAYGYKNSDTTKGQIHYMSGHDLSSDVSGNLFILETLLQLGGASLDPPPVSTEITRSSPIATTINAQPAIVQGTLVNVSPAPPPPTVLIDGDVAAFTFPAQQGHFYGTLASNITTAAQSFSKVPHIFDTAAEMNPGNYGACQGNLNKNHKAGTTCRAIFTNTTGGRFPSGGGGNGTTPSYLYIDKSAASTLATELQAATIFSTPLGSLATLTSGTLDTLLQTVVTSKLGGVDRSTAAVVAQSTLSSSLEGISGTTRPTMAYFGATDGMIHAVCIDVQAGTECDAQGRELWAFMPREEIPLIRFNETAVEGSPHVIEAFGDFYNTGTPSFKTILTFHTGPGDVPVPLIPSLIAGQTPAVYAIDITDPYVPRVLWEYTVPTPLTPRPYELGQGLFLDMGNVTMPSGLLHPITFAETNNGGTGGAAAVVTAIDTVTGAEMWTAPFGFPYVSGAHGDTPPVPATGVPGGAVTVDKHQNGSVSDLVFGDLYGNVWEVDPATGASRYGTNTPLFTATTIGHPIGAAPAIYSNGAHTFAAFATGGYADFTGAPPVNAGTQFVFSVMLDSSVGGLTELSTSQTNGQNNIGFMQPLAAGQDGFAQLTVVNNQIFVTTDNTNVNDAAYGSYGSSTGQATGYTLNSTGGISATVVFGSIPGGAGSLAAVGTTLYASTGGAEQQLSTAASATPGSPVNFDNQSKLQRLLFLRTK